MMLRNFETSDIKNAINVTNLVWGDFYKQESARIQNLIYEITFKYYDLNRNFSYSIFDDDKNFKGFLFAFKKDDKNESSNILNNEFLQLDGKEQKILKELYNFLDFCGKETKNFMQKDDIMLGLFVSTKKGGGKTLISELIKQCRKQNIKHLFLWSDTTCDYDYYLKNNFEKVKEIKTNLNNNDITVFIFKKEI